MAGNVVACPVLLAFLMALVAAVSTKDTNMVADVPWSKEDEQEQLAAIFLLKVFDQSFLVGTVFDQCCMRGRSASL